MKSGGSQLAHQQSVGESWIYMQPTSYLLHPILDLAPAPQGFFKCSLTAFLFFFFYNAPFLSQRYLSILCSFLPSSLMV